MSSTSSSNNNNNMENETKLVGDRGGVSNRVPSPTNSPNYYYPGCGWPVPQYALRRKQLQDNSSGTEVKSDDGTTDVNRVSVTVNGGEEQCARPKVNFCSSRQAQPSVSNGSEAGPCRRSSDRMNGAYASNGFSYSKSSDSFTSRVPHSTHAQQRTPLGRKPKIGSDFSADHAMGYDPSRKHPAFPNHKPNSFSSQGDNFDNYRQSVPYNGNNNSRFSSHKNGQSETSTERAYSGNDNSRFGSHNNGSSKTSTGKTYNGNDNSRFSYKNHKIGNLEIPAEIARGPRVGSNSSTSDCIDNKKEEFGVFGLNVHRDKYNSPDFETNYDNAKFYIIKSFSEDDVHKCLKYDVWSSTTNGNNKLDAAFKDAEAKAEAEDTKCPIFLFFSVNRSGQFVGMAEMIGKVDFKKDMDFWQQDRWIGFFPVRWHIIKDIPHSQLQHIILENNENKPVTFTRDTQEVEMKPGLEMLKIFKDYSAKTSLIDDYTFYENREQILSRENDNRTETPSMDLSNDYKNGNNDFQDRFVKPQRKVRANAGKVERKYPT